MLSRTLTLATLLAALVAGGAAAQDASSVVAAASKAMGADNLNSITYGGTARNGLFGQSKSIGEPMAPTNTTQITQYTRTINFAQPAEPAALVSRATGPTLPPTVPGLPAPVPGVFNQNITRAQAGGDWKQGLNIWTTPWGFLKGAAANNPKVRKAGSGQVVSFVVPDLKSPSGQPYTVTGHINAQNQVTKVETRVDDAVVGDLLVEFDYSNYQNMNGVQVPTRVVQRQAGMPTFDANITSATPNPANLATLLTVTPAPGAGRAPAAAPTAAPPVASTPVERIGDGVFKFGGNYTSLAIDMGDHILVLESGLSDARGLAVMAAAKQAIPNKPIRYVVNSHPHFDHAAGLGAAVADGATILTHRNSEPALERLLSGPRTLMGDSLSKVSKRRSNVVQGVGDKDVRKGTNGKIVELHRVVTEHTDSLLVAYLPAEKVVFSADVTVVNSNPAQAASVRSAVATFNRLGIHYEIWIPSHPPTPDLTLTKADVTAAAAPRTN